MEWSVEYTDEFGSWWDELTEAEQISISAHVRKLEQRGPNLLAELEKEKSDGRQA